MPVNEKIIFMKCVYADDWNQSFWFIEWLNLARKQNEAATRKERQPSETGKKKPGSVLCHEIPPLFTDWSFSVRENSSLHLPELNSGLQIAEGTGRHLDAPHQTAFG
jgi:hypothetical protein